MAEIVPYAKECPRCHRVFNAKTGERYSEDVAILIIDDGVTQKDLCRVCDEQQWALAPWIDDEKLKG